MPHTTDLPRRPRRAWFESLFWLTLAWAGFAALLQPSASSLVAVWMSSETYAHGFVILPISLWLVWQRRQAIVATPAAPDWRALAACILFCLLWLASRIGGAQVGEHYALVALLITSVWAIYGVRLTRAMLFPLAYLLFMVPSGDSLIDPLIDITADFTVAVVRLFGIPVYREGTFFSLPSGDWSVVEACSGMRYLLASLALGWLYAYLSYRSWRKQLAFGVASLIVPVFANGLRAALIVLLGHYSGMELAVGVDHLIYGWLWFGVVMMFMFWAGNHWREDEPEAAAGPVQTPAPAGTVVMALLLLAALFTVYEGRLRTRAAQPSPLAAVQPARGWQPLDKAFTGWRPHWKGMTDERTLFLGRAEDRVMLYMAWYGAQHQGQELIYADNRLTPERHPVWRRTSEHSRQVRTGEVREAQIDAGAHGQRLLVWYWNRIQGQQTVNPFKAKANLALNKLLNRPDSGAVVILAAPYAENADDAARILSRFLDDMEPVVSRALDRR